MQHLSAVLLFYCMSLHVLAVTSSPELADAASDAASDKELTDDHVDIDVYIDTDDGTDTDVPDEDDMEEFDLEEDLDDGTPASRDSQQSSAARIATFVNKQISPVWLFYIKGNSETLLVEIPGERVQSMNTFEGQRFVIRAGPDPFDVLLGEVTATSAAVQQHILTKDGQVFSPEDGGRVAVTFHNSGLETLWLFYLNPDTEHEVELTSIEPGARYTMRSFAGHEFISRNGPSSSGALVRQLALGYEPKQSWELAVAPRGEL